MNYSNIKPIIKKSLLAVIDAALAVIALWFAVMLKFDYLQHVEPMINNQRL
jgi:hypothetical protein